MKIKLLAIGTILSLANLAEAQISNSHILAHYKLDGNGSDSSGNEQHATEYSITGATDRFGKANGACYFNGTNTYLKTPNSATISPADSISISLWVYQEEKTNIGWSPLIDKRYAFTSDPYSSYGIATHPNYDYKWMFSVSSGTPGSAKTATAKAYNPFENWTFVAATYNRNQVKIYINGVLDSAVSKTGPIGYSNLDLFIGYSGTGPNEYYKGKMDDLRIYGRILTPAEIQALYSAPNAVSEKEIGTNSITIYPNPVNNSLRVDSELSWKSASIYDMLGKQIWKGDFEAELAIYFLEAGHYILTLTDESGVATSKRFVKE
jgi:hypothetical protein